MPPPRGKVDQIRQTRYEHVTALKYPEYEVGIDNGLPDVCNVAIPRILHNAPDKETSKRERGQADII